jgi:hypothetical protein
MITKLPPAIEIDEDVVVLLFRSLRIDMNELPGHPQMKHPNHIIVERNEDIFRYSPDSNDRLSLDVPG